MLDNADDALEVAEVRSDIVVVLGLINRLLYKIYFIFPKKE
jgi:hypothetical protein